MFALHLNRALKHVTRSSGVQGVCEVLRKSGKRYIQHGECSSYMPSQAQEKQEANSQGNHGCTEVGRGRNALEKLQVCVAQRQMRVC